MAVINEWAFGYIIMPINNAKENRLIRIDKMELVKIVDNAVIATPMLIVI